ncbi:MAG: PH domain-containing protein, partial [Erythrobacter sp.]
MIEPLSPGAGEPRRTAPLGLLVSAIGNLRQSIVAIAAGFFALRDELSGLGAIGAIVVAVVAINMGIAWLAWLRRTYTTGPEDIRVESGIVSRAARSVPYERIQDVSLEQKFLPRLFGLVEVKFETGAGGAEDIKLAYLTEGEGEALRRLVRERREDDVIASPAASGPETARAEPVEEPGEVLFAMDGHRLTTFGLFEFSLAAFAVLGGLAQYLETFAGIELWDPDLWLDLAKDQRGKIATLGPMAQALGAVAGVVALVLVGSATGLVRTFLRDWGFVLERTARGFRRRRGLFTRTDVVMPRHRVQAVEIGTGLVRYRFGWHGLKFVSLAQDAGSSSHVVAPFARIEEIEPVIHAAGFTPPSDALDWQHASRAYRRDTALLEGGIFVLLAIPVVVFAPLPFVLVPLALAPFFAGANL